MHLCSVVFAGGEIPPSTFDERRLFGGHLDPEQIKVGPIAQFGYASNRYRFEVAPNRIDIKETQASSILSDELMEAAQAVADMLGPIRQAIPVTGVGLNCDSVFSSRVIGTKGSNLCSRLMHTEAATVFGAHPIQPFVRARFLQGTLTYDVKVEPHVQSRGEDLFVAVNGHKDIVATEPINYVLDQATPFREYAHGLHQRIIGLKSGGIAT